MSSKINQEVYNKNFDTLKSQQLNIEDASRKSSIDFHIRPLVNAINESDNYFTTSSCSGRFLAFSQVRLVFFSKIFPHNKIFKRMKNL